MTLRQTLLGLVLASCSALNAFDVRSGLELIKTKTDGRLNLSARNVSGGPITAYVVVVRNADGSKTQVFKARYTRGDTMSSGETAVLASFNGSEAESVDATVDFVRLASGHVWGDCRTDECRQITADSAK